MANKKEKVMEALSARGKFQPGRKGVNLLGIVKKLSDKRKAKEEDGKGGPGFDLIKKTGSNLMKGAKNFGYDALDVIERGKLKPNEIPMKFQPDFVKKEHIAKLPRTLGSKVGGAVGEGLASAVKAIANPVGVGVSIAKKLSKNRQNSASTSKISDGARVPSTPARPTEGMPQYQRKEMEKVMKNIR